MLLAVTALLLGVTTTILSPLPAWATVYRLCYGYTSCSNAGMGNAGYAQNNGTMYWRMYSGHNCTNYAAYRMVRSGMANERPWSGGGNATYWGSYMVDITNQTPTVGAIAWWRAGVYPAGSAGHVAYVEKVISSTEIIVSQDSWGGDFSWARITKTGSGWPSGFVHFHDVKMANLTRPTVSGNLKVGSKLTATAGTWDPGSPTTKYQWIVGGLNVQGATSSTLTLTDDMVGKKVWVEVTATKDGYPSGTATSERSTKVLPGELRATTSPTVSGTPQVGETLTGSAGDWSPNPDETRFQWLLDGAPVDGATTSTFALTPTEAGKQVALKVVAVRAGYKKVVATTAAEEVQPGTLEPSGDLTVTGDDMTPGQKLFAASVPTVSPRATRTVQWVRDDEPIAGATERRYVLTDADLGHRVRALVQWVKDGYTSVEMLSDRTARVRTEPTLQVDLSRTNHRVEFSVDLSAEGVDEIGSVIAIRDERGRVLKLKNLPSDGSVVIRLPRQEPGEHTYSVSSRRTDATRRVMVEKSITVR